jgi:tetratricopeptide (TPR) repeat protein
MDWERVARAGALRDEGRFEQARHEFRKLFDTYAEREDQPGDLATVVLNEIDCLLRLERHSEAETRLRDLERLSASSLSSAMADLTLAEIRLEQGRNAGALDAAERALEKHRSSLEKPEYEFILAKLIAIKGLALAGLKRCAEAVPILKNTLTHEQLGSDLAASVHLHLGLCLRALREPGAREQFDSAIEITARPTVRVYAHYGMGVMYYEDEGFAAAIVHLLAVEKDLSSFEWPHRELYKLLSKAFAAIGEKSESRRYADLAARAEQ